MIDIGLYITYAVLSVAIVTAILLPLLNAIKHPGGLLKSLLGVAVLAGVIGLTFLISDGSLSPRALSVGITESGSKLIGAGLTTLAILLGSAFVGVILSEIKSTFK